MIGLPDESRYGIDFIGFAFQDFVDISKESYPILRAFGVLEEEQRRGLGTAIALSLFEKLNEYPFVLADIEHANTASLACLTKVADICGRTVSSIGIVEMKWSEEVQKEVGVLTEKVEGKEGDMIGYVFAKSGYDFWDAHRAALAGKNHEPALKGGGEEDTEGLISESKKRKRGRQAKKISHNKNRKWNAQVKRYE